MNIDRRTSVAELLEENQRLRKKVRVARRNNRELRRALRALKVPAGGPTKEPK